MKSVNLWTKNWAQNKGLNVWYEPETDSTNLKAKEKGRQFHLYLTDHQTQGRGRGGAHWHNADRGSIFMASWTFVLNTPPQPIASPLFGLAVYSALKSTWPSLALSLKAPNDIYLGEKKLAGLLIEGVSTGEQSLLVVGIGLNALAHPKELPTATHLAQHTEVTPELWNQFLDTLISYLNEMTILATDTDIPEAFCHQLREALNYFPLKDEQVLEVDARGNIISSDSVTRWFDL